MRDGWEWRVEKERGSKREGRRDGKCGKVMESKAGALRGCEGVAGSVTDRQARREKGKKSAKEGIVIGMAGVQL